jgi:hypothetical protein
LPLPVFAVVLLLLPVLSLPVLAVVFLVVIPEGDLLLLFLPLLVLAVA